MQNYREHEIVNQWKPLVIISAVLCILSFLGNIMMLIIQPKSLPFFYEGTAVYDLEYSGIVRYFLIVCILDFLLYGAGLLFGILIQKRKKTGLYAYTLYLILRFYLIYNMMMETGTSLAGWISSVFFIFEAIIILKLWFSEDGKIWFHGKTTVSE
jgi:hypothetical protein